MFKEAKIVTLGLAEQVKSVVLLIDSVLVHCRKSVYGPRSQWMLIFYPIPTLSNFCLMAHVAS